MSLTDNFSDCIFNGCFEVFKQHNVPVFQNKLYTTPEEARAAAKGKVSLVRSKQSGFVFNNEFDPAIMNYDQNYNNEQSSSPVFKAHMNGVLELLKSFGTKGKKVVEVGSGKGVFFDMMLQDGVDCYGFDPTYEGENPRIIKEYFSEEYNAINADVIVMRHTLEHIPNPFSFLHTIAKANNYKGKLFVEVPTFDWIVQKEAFWDIFYEHCNYFTEETLAVMFKEASTGSFFGGQYIYLWADLNNLQTEIPVQPIKEGEGLLFNKKIKYYLDFMEAHQPLAIWGGGAKGSTFLNLMDPEKKLVSFVVDINPSKQHKYISGTAHKVCSPDELQSFPSIHVLVMNENYLEEIRDSLQNDNIQLHTL
ncbi:MAG TPA: class I SAM-dependent methyltransferase [Puia sp.]|nr:class I SAM-dependent methyltransferase [Puia sp.]